MGKKLFLEDNKGFVELLAVFGDDLTIVNAARVSFHKESAMEKVLDENTKTETLQLSKRDAKLIQFLAKHHHITPFFHPIIRFRIKMPIFVVREWYRHSIGFARNEVSRRYVTNEPELFIPEHLRMRDENLKQGSKSKAIPNNKQHVQQMKKFCQETQKYYNSLLENNICPEQARMILPQSMYTEFIETASLAAYARLVNLRIEASAQREIQSYAQHISTFLKEKFPVSWSALIKH